MSPPSPEHAVRLVVLRVHAVRHMNGIGQLRRDYQVHLEQAGLQWALLLRVALEDVELEGRGLLQGVVLHEDVGDYSRARHALGGTGDAIA